MKKTIVFTLLFTMLLSLCVGGFSVSAAESDIVADILDPLSIRKSGSGVSAGENSGHGNHQTRTVHTFHGDYAAYITDSIKQPDSTGTTVQIDQFSVIRVKDGVSEVVFQGYKNYDTSQVSIFADKDENIWAVTVYNNGYKAQFDGRDLSICLDAYRIDKNTDEVLSYSSIVPIDFTTNIGYSASCYDPVYNKIYAISSAGHRGSNPCMILNVFDMETLEWESNPRELNLSFRHAYFYMYADGKGGLIVVANRDYKCTEGENGSYNEIQSDYGLSEEDKQYLTEKNGERWAASYFWDQLDLYYISDVNSEEFQTLSICPADFSQVKGDETYRYSVEGRENNYYPNVQNNNGGETFIDANGYLHVIYNKQLVNAAWNRGLMKSSEWKHMVVDISDPNNMKILYDELILDEVTEKTDASFRLYEDENDNLYMLSSETPIGASGANCTLYVYKVNGTPSEGYTYQVIGSKDYVGGECINISNARGNFSESADDGVINVIYHNMGGNDYKMIQVKLSTAAAPDNPNPPTGSPVAICVIAGIAALTLGITAVRKKTAR